MTLVEVICGQGIVQTFSGAEKLIKQGLVRINNIVATDPDIELNIGDQVSVEVNSKRLLTTIKPK